MIIVVVLVTSIIAIIVTGTIVSIARIIISGPIVFTILVVKTLFPRM